MIRPALAVLAAAALSLAASSPAQACWDSGRPRYASSDATFTAARTAGAWVVGDSIMVSDFPDLDARFKALGATAAYDAEAGIPAGPSADRLIARANRLGWPRVVVMAVGTNNFDVLGAYGDPVFQPPALTEAADLVLGAAPASTTVIWVNVWAKRWRSTQEVQDADVQATAELNQRLSAEAPAHPNLRIAGWWVTCEGTPPTVALYDGIHTTDAGRAKRNALIAAWYKQVSP